MEEQIMTLEQAHGFAAEVLMKAKTSAENAASVASALVAAEADGLKGHGLSRLPSYAKQAKAGKVDGHAVPEYSQTASSILTVDAKHGFAYPALEMGVEKLADCALRQGVAALGVYHSHHCGAAGYHVEGLAEQGLVGLMFANAPACIAPWGGSHAVYGTNPIAFASPQQNRAPLVVDLSVSKAARGNIMAAAQTGAPIPEGWALDVEGRPTSNAKAALAGTMLPMGGAKGTALALIVEIFSSVLVGASSSFQATSFFDEKGPPPATGQFVLALNPAPFGPGYLERLACLASMIEAQAGARLPGARRLENRAAARKKGVIVSHALLKLL